MKGIYLILILILSLKEIYSNHFYFFPNSIKTNWRNNYAFLFESNFFTEQKKFFVVHRGKEGFQIILKEPIINKNHSFEIKNQCFVIEGKFHISLLIKKSQKIMDIPFKIETLKQRYLEEAPHPYNILIDRATVIQYLKQSETELHNIMDVEILGIRIIPLTSRIAFYCDEFSMTREKFLIF